MDTGSVEGSVNLEEAKATLRQVAQEIAVSPEGREIITALQQGATIMGRTITLTVEVSPGSDQVEVGIKVGPQE